jgi:tetratricopeptide (TPR) repeat protein
VAFVSPDGQFLVSVTHNIAGPGTRFKLWDSKGRLLAKLPYPDIDWIDGFSPDGRWLYIGGKTSERLEVASLITKQVQEKASAQPRDGPSQLAGWRHEPMRRGGVFSPDGRLAAYSHSDGSIQLVLPESDETIALLPAPETGGLAADGFSPDGPQLLARSHESGTAYFIDLRRIREQLADLGLDWGLPPYPPARPEEVNPTLAPPLQVELIDASAAGSAPAFAEYERRHAVAHLFANPSDAFAHYRLGARLLEAGKAKPAYEHLSAALAFRPDLDEALYARALAAFRLRRWPDAVDHATRALAKCAFEHRARSLRGEANLNCRRYQKAIEDFTAVLAIYPNNAQYYLFRSRCYAALGQQDRAQADREQAVKTGGNNAAIALNNEAWRLATGPADDRDAAQALELIRVAIRQLPDSPMTLNTLGVAEYRNGLYRQALATLEKSLAVGKGESDGFDLFFLAMCHARLGDRPRGRDCFDRAVQWVAARTKAAKLSESQSDELRRFQAEAEAGQEEGPAMP